MEEGWKKIYSTDKPYQAEMAVELLDENGIIGIVINKKDSSYLAFGNVEVFVKEEDSDKAKEIINQSKL
jgi:hypothetical protein